MNLKRYAAPALAAWAVVVLSACGRERDEPRVDVPPAVERAPAQAERAMEKAGAVFDDATVTAKVKTALIAEPGLSGMAIDVDTAQNVVTLKGTVSSDEQRRRAETIARGVEGVKEVNNTLTVKAS